MKAVLAYSAGLDTTVIAYWLKEQGHEVHAVYVDVGQPGEKADVIKSKANAAGVKSLHIVDVKEELCRDFAFPCMQWQAYYERTYMMGTAIARPIITKACMQIARELKADAFVHGATGKGNDQCRFQLAAEALDPSVKIIAPWRLQTFRDQFPGRQEMLAYCDEKGITMKSTVNKTFSCDENCLHISYEAGPLENLATFGLSAPSYRMTVMPQDAPDQVEEIKISFEKGVPVKINDIARSPFEIVNEANIIGGRNGIGLIDIVENRYMGMKSRGVYEAPGMTVLFAAHRYLQEITLDKKTLHFCEKLLPEFSELVYNGFWYSRKMDLLLSINTGVQEYVTGEIVLNLYKGNIQVVSRQSQNSLYDDALASMEGGGTYNQADAGGFLAIEGLPLRVEGRVTPRKY